MNLKYSHIHCFFLPLVQFQFVPPEVERSDLLLTVGTLLVIEAPAGSVSTAERFTKAVAGVETISPDKL